MRRAIPFLAAAAALATAGCTSRTCDPAVLNVYWETFTDASGRAFHCSDANSGVASIQVFVEGQPQFSQPISCVPFANGTEGIGLVDFAPGTYQIDVQAFDVAGNLIYQDQVSTVVAGNTCNLQQRVDLNPTAVTGDLNVAYGLSGACRTPTLASPFPTTFLWYQLLDQNGQLASAANRTVNPQAIPCSDTNRKFTIPGLPFGTYTLSGLQEVELVADGTFIVYAFNCVPFGPFSHLAPNDLITVPTLVDQATGGTVTCF